MVARDGYPLYATLLQIPFGHLYVDPRGQDVRWILNPAIAIPRYVWMSQLI